MKIATLGPKGTFSHQAAQLVKKDAEIIFCKTIHNVLETVQNKKAEWAVVPIENSVAGTMGLTLDALMEFDLSICKEKIVPIRHNLVVCNYFGISKIPKSYRSPKGVCSNSSEIKKIYIHPQTYAQCEHYLEKNYPHCEFIETSSNGKSAELLLSSCKSGEVCLPLKGTSGQARLQRYACISGQAAVVPELAAKIYKLKIIQKDIQDNKFNVTRFIVLAENGVRKTGYDRTSIALYPQIDRPGLLYDLLGEFAKRKINLTKIESRPSKGKLGDYIFFIDFQGHIEDLKVKEALKALEKVAFLRILGSYPRKY
jgi:prephenate dehydratase